MPYLNIQIRHCEYQYFIFGKDRIHRNYQIEFYAEVFIPLQIQVTLSLGSFKCGCA